LFFIDAPNAELQVVQLQRDRVADDRKRALKKVMEREQRLEQVSSLFTRRFLSDWDATRQSSEIIDLAWAVGVPPKLRAEVWPLAIDNALLITPEVPTR
jgi:hypothetical protein